ncbi:hypothetical protein, partial [Rhizobium leguminosarum]|uniref:hypothetical protein n=1 Tax=Rhizobium leguminosarum TaxID=384 RepID=UPI003F94B4DC
PTALYRFEVRYTDVDGEFPASTYPHLLLDFEGNGDLSDANDRLFYMQEKDPDDQDVTDGKDYYFLTSALPQSADWKTSVVAMDAIG